MSEMPEFNPEPPDDQFSARAPEPMECPDCRVGQILDRWRCNVCGLEYDDLLAASSWWKDRV